MQLVKFHLTHSSALLYPASSVSDFACYCSYKTRLGLSAEVDMLRRSPGVLLPEVT